MSPALQAKLLRVLQEGTVERLGSTKPIKVNARIIAATNKNLENDIISRCFREDLYYRLKVITISLPPLRMRKEDIPILTAHFIQKHSKGVKGENYTLHPDSMNALMEYNWPGNIRELENVIKRAIILSHGSIISPHTLFDGQGKGVSPPAQTSRLSNYLTQKIIEQGGEIYRLVLEELEYDLIEWAMAKTGGNQVQAAKLLGISRMMLHERLEKYRLR